MKISRRTIVKGIGAGIFSTTATSVLANAGKDSQSGSNDPPKTFNPQDTLRVQIAHKWGENSIAAVIRNTSGRCTTITNINSVTADYGRFNFSNLTRNGPVTLAAGEEVHVPFTVMGTPAKPFGHFDNRLQKHLQRSLYISTDTSKIAKVVTSMGPRVV